MEKETPRRLFPAAAALALLAAFSLALFAPANALAATGYANGARYHQQQGYSWYQKGGAKKVADAKAKAAGCGVTAFTMAANIALQSNKHYHVDVYRSKYFKRDSTVNLASKSRRWAKAKEKALAVKPLTKIYSTDEIRGFLQLGYAVVLSSGQQAVFYDAHGNPDGAGAHASGHFICIYAYGSGKFYANDPSKARDRGAGAVYTDSQMQAWLDARPGNHPGVLVKPKSAEHKISYRNVIAGAVAPVTTKFNSKHALFLPSPSNVPAGFKFLGWYTKKDGGKKVTRIAYGTRRNVTVYAHWKAEPANPGASGGNAGRSYAIAFNANGGSGTMATIAAAYNASVKLPKCTFAAPYGCKFKGWARSAKGYAQFPGEAQVKNLSFANGSTVTLYAKWEGVPYKVKYEPNGAAWPASTQNMAYGKTATLKRFASRKGYKLAGWNTQPDGSGTGYAPGASVSNLAATEGAEVALYAQWQKK